jgi:hypothetical protein
VTHYAAPEFWARYQALPAEIQKLADRAFDQIKADPQHPSLHFKRTGTFWSARIGLHYRALGVAVRDGVLWFWIGTHGEYDRMVG